MGGIRECAWKLVDSGKFVMGQSADRCGTVAVVRIKRPTRKSDLFLCENHTNEFIKVWGLHNEIEILCNNWLEGEQEARFLNSHKIVSKYEPQCYCPETHVFPDGDCMPPRRWNS